MSLVFIISAPSGSGKSTLVKRLLEGDAGLLFSVSFTTRAPRGTERPGEGYHYITREDFEARIAAGEFLEYAEVFGHLYGTHRGVLEQAGREGKDLVLDIDVQGARQLRGKLQDAVGIFILPPSREVLEQRLRARSEDDEAVIQRRLREAAEEIRGSGSYDYIVVNNELGEAAGLLAAIVKAERARRGRSEHAISKVLATF